LSRRYKRVSQSFWKKWNMCRCNNYWYESIWDNWWSNNCN